jgi:hypothetical protein
VTSLHRRVLIAVEPYLLATVLARILREGPGGGRFQAVDVKSPRRALAPDAYDVAIVTGDLPPGVRAGLLIGLPEDGGRRGTVTADSLTTTVTIEGVETIVRLMEEPLLPLRE